MSPWTRPSVHVGGPPVFSPDAYGTCRVSAGKIDNALIDVRCVPDDVTGVLRTTNRDIVRRAAVATSDCDGPCDPIPDPL